MSLGAGGSAEALYDDLAGVVDLFGAMTRAELERALEELAFKQGQSADADALSGAVSDAVEAYYLVEYDAPDAPETLLAVGPVAFPTLPSNAEDLPHILDVPSRDPGLETLAPQVRDQFRRDAATAVSDGDTDRIQRLLDVSYDLEAWGPIDVAEERERLDDALHD
jgi:hypothetical protein